MQEKTLNKIMEEIAELYETRPYLKINDFYVSIGLNYEKDVHVHFSTFGQTVCRYIMRIAEKYNLEWVIQPHLSIDGDVCVHIYDPKRVLNDCIEE